MAMKALGPGETRITYYKLIYGDNSNVINTVLLKGLDATVFDLKLKVSSIAQLTSNTFDVYYNDKMLTDNEIIRTYNIPKGNKLQLVKIIPLTIQRDQHDFILQVNHKLTVGELKAKLQDDYDFPSEFQLCHPGQADNILDDNLTMLSVAGNAISNKLIAIEIGKVESENTD
ncbi:hypothetical protein ACFE04_014931 [Oxalis oulophora]